MTPILDFLAILAVLLGTLFSFAGVLGYVRLPDVYTRLHATGKVGLYGVVLLLVAAVVGSGVAVSKALALIFFLLIAGPATAHALASAAYRVGIRPRPAARDDLAATVEPAPPPPRSRQSSAE